MHGVIRRRLAVAAVAATVLASMAAAAPAAQAAKAAPPYVLQARFTLARVLQTCVKFSLGCAVTAMPMTVTHGRSGWTIMRTDGNWEHPLALTFSRGAWRASGSESGASQCDYRPASTTVTITLQADSGSLYKGQPRAVNGTYTADQGPTACNRYTSSQGTWAVFTNPGWWTGTCDVSGHPGSSALAASFNGIQACGPGPYQGGSDVTVHFYPGAFGEYEWECVELVMRYMWLVYGIEPYNAPSGALVVSNYNPKAQPASAVRLVKVKNDGHSLPSPGDIVSFGTDHTGVVTSVSVKKRSGTVEIMQQNVTGNNGWYGIPVRNNMLGGAFGGVTGWLHDPR